MQKDSIEDKLGVELTWDRSDNRKLSRIYHRLEGVSYAEESDWERASDFHAKWSKVLRRFQTVHLGAQP